VTVCRLPAAGCMLLAAPTAHCTVVMKFLIVRLGSFGDIVHALPAVAALRERFPAARIDWLVDARYAAILRLVSVLDRVIVLGGSREADAHAIGTDREMHFAGWQGLWRALADLRRSGYEVAFDLQGLIKSAVLARGSGAKRVIGFDRAHLREQPARFFYTETCNAGGTVHVVDKNLSALAAVGISNAARVFPIDPVSSPVVSLVRERLGLAGSVPFAVINPGGGWPNKRWPPDRYGAVAAAVRDRHGLRSVVLWGPGEQALADKVTAASGGAAAVAPPTDVAGIIALARAARLFLAGDTGPLHVAAAAGAPVVGIYGPTDPARNGPWDPGDQVVSRYNACACHYERRCHEARWCLLDIAVEEIVDAIDRRLAASHGRQ
jgi:heptosyltransferase-1